MRVLKNLLQGATATDGRIRRLVSGGIFMNSLFPLTVDFILNISDQIVWASLAAPKPSFWWRHSEGVTFGALHQAKGFPKSAVQHGG